MSLPREGMKRMMREVPRNIRGANYLTGVVHGARTGPGSAQRPEIDHSAGLRPQERTFYIPGRIGGANHLARSLTSVGRGPPPPNVPTSTIPPAWVHENAPPRPFPAT
jgi:hypothetical protein